MMLAANAARATCPSCGRQVRGGVELQARLVELQEAVAEANTAGSTYPGGGGEYMEVVRVARHELERMAAELAGAHLRCVEQAAARWAVH